VKSSSAAPPFRADHIGSLLRPPALLALRARFARGEIERAELTAAEDRAIEDALRLQERVGLRVATDGEFRRRSYHSYFYRQLGDITPDAVIADSGSPGARGAQPAAVINSKLQWTHPIHVADFEFIRQRTRLVPKITIPGPCALHFRGGDAAVTAHAYRDVDEFWDDTVAAFRSELLALAAAGCSYVQMDETAFAKFADTEVLANLAARGDQPDALVDRYIAVINRVLRGMPAGLRIGMHLCRGNRGGLWHAEGGYEAVAERLFNSLDIDRFLLEYDTPRAGSFAPLRLLPAHKSVVLGLVSTKTAELEPAGDLKRRIEEASRYVDGDRLAISPQCGFASVDTGNPLSIQAQEAKLRRVVEVAESVWSSA
jgi:5-methyltetrahydropteroyltriglutamate--homocysteine methyltransferase